MTKWRKTDSQVSIINLAPRGSKSIFNSNNNGKRKFFKEFGSYFAQLLELGDRSEPMDVKGKELRVRLLCRVGHIICRLHFRAILTDENVPVQIVKFIITGASVLFKQIKTKTSTGTLSEECWMKTRNNAKGS